MKVEVCYADAFVATRIEVDGEGGLSVGDAVERSGIATLLSMDPDGMSFAVFGRNASPDDRLHDGDRVEILRPLQVDPKEARHRRVAHRRATKTAGEGDPSTR